MASPVIKIKRSAVQNNAPTAAQLELGELALNTYDGKLFTEINDGTTSIVEIGGHLKHLAATGISTFGSDKVVVGAAQTQFLVRGNGRVVGVLTVGSGSVTLNDDSVNVGAGTTILTTGFQIGGSGVFVHSTGYNVGNTFVHNAGITGAGANLSGIVTSVGLDINGNISVSGTVDGRDIATDGSKLDGIEASATADQTAAEIRTLVESASDSNVFTDADHTKLNAIEASATADQTAAEIRTLVESASDSNVFTDADHSKLNAIEASATADQTAAEIKTLLNSNGLVNAQIDASAAIAGTKISPDFGSQTIATSGVTNLSGELRANANIKMTNASPKITFTDDNDNPDFEIGNLNGIFRIRDATNSANRLVVNTDGHVDVLGNLDVGAGIDVTGNITVSGTVDGRDVATDGTKLDGIEASADVTDATNVNAAGAVMNSDSTTASMSFVVDEDNMSSDSSTKVPTQQSVKAYVDSEVSGLVDSAPGALNTLNELAAALGDDANFSTTVTNSIATKLPLGGGTMTGNIVMSGSQTVDGRDLSVDGAKLDAIESSATADQTAAEIRTLVESASDSNVFTDADHSKLNAIEASATADQTAAEIRTLVESASDSNVFTDADHSKLNAIEASATADQTASEILTLIKTVDGAGSGLDADTLDGVSSGSFVRSDATDTVSGALTFTNDATFTGKISASNNAIHANVYSTGISTISGFRFPTSDGDEDQALVTDGSGSLSFKTLSGGGGGATGAATTISAGITTATQGQTAFSTPHPHNDGTSTYSCQVFVNGIKQRPQGASSTKDFTTSSNSTITFVEGLTVGAEVVSVVYFGHTIDEEYFTATQGQVLFPLSGSLSAQKNFRVFVNGVKQRVGSDFGVAAPVTLVQACAEGAHVEIVCDNAEDAFVATDQQTNFTPTSTDISEDNMQVFVNGVQLFKGLDYTIGSPSVTFTDATGLTVGDEVDVCIRRTA